MEDTSDGDNVGHVSNSAHLRMVHAFDQQSRRAVGVVYQYPLHHSFATALVLLVARTTHLPNYTTVH